MWTLANATVDHANSAMSSSLLGVAVGTNSTTHGMLVRGIVQVNGITDTEIVGNRVYVGESNGTFTYTAPSTDGDVVRVVGYSLATSKIYFNPDSTWVVIA